MSPVWVQISHGMNTCALPQSGDAALQRRLPGAIMWGTPAGLGSRTVVP